MEGQSNKSPDFGLQADHDSYHLPKKKGIKTTSSLVTARLPQKMKLAGTKNIWLLLLFFLVFLTFPYSCTKKKRHFKSKKDIKENFTTIGKSFQILNFMTRGFIWRVWINCYPPPPRGDNSGDANSFVQMAGVPWGWPLGMPAGKCIRLRNRPFALRGDVTSYLWK